MIRSRFEHRIRVGRTGTGGKVDEREDKKRGREEARSG